MKPTVPRYSLSKIREEVALMRRHDLQVQAQVSIRLSEIMGRHRIKQTELARASELRLATISALYHDQTDALSKRVVARVLMGLRDLTGQEYTVGDLVHFTPLDVNPLE